MKKRLLSFLLVFAMVFGTVAVKNPIAALAAGKYVYAVTWNEIVKINTKTGKADLKRSKALEKEHWAELEGVLGLSLAQEYNEYIYFTKNANYDPSCYVCRIKKNGAGLQKLGKGRDFVINKNKIYYTAYDFGKNTVGQCKVKGIYQMNLDGKSKKKIIGGYELLGIYSGKLYAKTSKIDQRKIISLSMNGKNRKDIAASKVDFSESYMSGGMLYYDASVYQDNGKYKYGYYVINLKNGKIQYQKSKGKFAGVDGMNLFFNDNKGVLYCKKKGAIKEKKMLKGLVNVKLYSSAVNTYIVVGATRLNADAFDLFTINSKTHKYGLVAASGN